MPRMELPGTKKRGRPKRRCMDALRENMAVVEVTEKGAEHRNRWRSMEHPLWRSLKGEAKRRRLNNDASRS